jgi:hypothetical protein
MSDAYSEVVERALQGDRLAAAYVWKEIAERGVDTPALQKFVQTVAAALVGIDTIPAGKNRKSARVASGTARARAIVKATCLAGKPKPAQAIAANVERLMREIPGSTEEEIAMGLSILSDSEVFVPHEMTKEEILEVIRGVRKNTRSK